MAQSNKNVSFHVVLVEVSIVTKLCFFCCFPGQVFFAHLSGCEANCVILEMVYLPVEACVCLLSFFVGLCYEM